MMVTQTVKERISSMLEARGMSQDQANKVIDLTMVELQKIVPHYEITLDRPAHEYPQIIYGVVFQVMKPIAFKWIIDNVPAAWFKESFN
jgi:hypothetical protein